MAEYVPKAALNDATRPNGSLNVARLEIHAGMAAARAVLLEEADRA